MKIRMRTTMAGPDGGCVQAGEIIDLDETRARALIDEGWAVAVASPRSPVQPDPSPDPSPEPASRRARRVVAPDETR